MLQKFNFLVEHLEGLVNKALTTIPAWDSDKLTQVADALRVDIATVKAGDIEKQFNRALEPLKRALQIEAPATESEKRQIQEAYDVISKLEKLLMISRTMGLDRKELESIAAIRGSFKELGDGTVEVALPNGVTFENAVELLNAAAKQQDLGDVILEYCGILWRDAERDPVGRTEPGKVYRFKICEDAVNKSKEEQLRDHGVPVPPGALVLADACKKLQSGTVTATLFLNSKGEALFVRCAMKGWALFPSRFQQGGVAFIHRGCDEFREPNVGFATLISAD